MWEEQEIIIKTIYLWIGIVLACGGLGSCLYLLVTMLSWPFIKLHRLDMGQDDLLDDMAAIKKKLNIKESNHGN